MAPHGARSKQAVGRGGSLGVGCRRCPSGVIRRLGGGPRGGASAARAGVDARPTRAMLPALYKHTQGKPFKASALRTFLRKRLQGKGKGLCVPTANQAEQLLRSLARSRRTVGGDTAEPLGAWQPQGVRYVDREGPCSVDNLQGYVQGPRVAGSSWVAWNEYGFVYRLHRVERRKGAGAAPAYEVTCSSAVKRHSVVVHRRTVCAPTEDGDAAEFKGSIVLEPRLVGVGRVAPTWTLIYLHSFSNKGPDYYDFPHYFGLPGTALRVVLPTAPEQEQTCFSDWMVWRGKKLQWRRIKFNSWFDYLTDRAGQRENDLHLESLLDMRARLHGLIRREAQRVGDPRRVILGGASQGCCVALDAALTYPEELGGVIGLVGHVLGNTPLDPAKRRMPLHLFHETTDQEMKWSWVRHTVKRLVDAGFNVTSRRELDPSGTGHGIQAIEGPWVRSALRRIIHGHGAAQ